MYSRYAAPLPCPPHEGEGVERRLKEQVSAEIDTLREAVHLVVKDVVGEEGKFDAQ
jgi:hypothetical protein